MKWAFLVSGIIEIIGGIICYAFPDFLAPTDAPFLFRLYAINALVLGLINIFLFIDYQEKNLYKRCFLAMMFFHSAVAMMTYGSSPDSVTHQLAATLTHLALFLIFFIGYMKDLKPDKEQTY